MIAGVIGANGTNDFGITGIIQKSHVKPITRYSSFTGTSAAAPHVTGVAGLMLAANPNLTPAAIKKILKESSDPIYNRKGVLLSFGRINAFRALQTVLINKDLAFSYSILGHAEREWHYNRF